VRVLVREHARKDGPEKLPNCGLQPRVVRQDGPEKLPQCTVGLSVVSGITVMSTSDHWIIQRHSNFDIDEIIHLLKQSWRGRVVGGLEDAGC
jgi:hypothetical protein